MSDRSTANAKPSSAVTPPAPRPAMHRAVLESDLDYHPQWDRLTRLMVTVMLILGAIWAIVTIGPFMQTLVIALLFAFVMFFPARWATRRLNLPWVLSVVLCYFALLIGIIISAATLVPSALDGIASGTARAQEIYGEIQTDLREWTPERGQVRVLGTVIDFNPVITPIRELLLPAEAAPSLKDSPFAPGQGALGDIGGLLGSIDLRGLFNQAINFAAMLAAALASITGLIANLLFAIFISLLMIIGLPQTNRTIADWIPSPYHREAALLMEKTERIWTGFLRGQITIGVIIGVLTFVQLTLMGIGNALLLAVVVALISLIPTIGGIIALVPLFLSPLLGGSSVLVDMSPVTLGLLTVVINLVMSQVVWNAVAPKILGDALNLPVVVIIVGVFIGAAVGGALGAFLVAPLMSTLWLFVNYLLSKVALKDPFPGQQPALRLGAAEFAESSDEAQENGRPARQNAPDAPR